MKNTNRTFLYFCFLFVAILACTKEVGLVTEVEFTLSETHDAEGFINEQLNTNITVTPEEILEGYEYFFSYRILSGEGYYETINGSRIDTDEKMTLDQFRASVIYVGTVVGEHRVQIIAEDTFGFVQETEITYDISNVPAVWTATTTIAQIELTNTAPVTLTLEQGVDVAATYEWSYVFESGSGRLRTPAPAEENIEIDRFAAILPGTYQYTFIPDALGVVDILFNLVDSNGQELTANLTIEVVEEIIDETPPVITLVGDNPFEVFSGTTYTCLLYTSPSPRD